MTMMKTLTFAVLLGLAVAGGGALSTGGGTVLAQPQTCGLLTGEEVQALAPNQSVTDAAPSGNQGGGAVSCLYTWGSGPGHFTLALSVRPASRAFVGIAQDGVRFRRFLEAFFRGVVALVAIGMVLERLLAVRALEVLFAGVPGHTQDFVIVALAHALATLTRAGRSRREPIR